MSSPTTRASRIACSCRWPQLGGAESGQVVIVEMTQQPGAHAQPVGRVTRVLGDHGAPGMETEIAIHSHSLPDEFPAEVLAEAEAYGTRIPQRAPSRAARTCATCELVTIDGEDARDFDDAVWCERASGGWKLIVAIADVGHYVRPGTPLDREARERGTSVYFPNRVLPMLPEALSNGLCSLVPDEDRLALCCELRVARRRAHHALAFFRGRHALGGAPHVPRGRRVPRASPTRGTTPRLEKLRERLLALHGVYKSFTRARSGRGALELDTPELKLKFDEQGRIAALVEQIAQRRAPADRGMHDRGERRRGALPRPHTVPTLYRVHGLPEIDRLETLRTFLREFGLWLPPPEEITPEHLRDLLQKIGDRPDAGLISTAVIRSMPQAVYQPGNIGHFGLALEHYAHFTSPIRRYPDLVVHRGIRQVLRRARSAGDRSSGTGRCRCSARIARSASGVPTRPRAARSPGSSAIYMQDHIGEEYDGIVSGVVDFGLFVQLEGMQVDGLLHVSALGPDYFARDSSGFRMVGRSSGRCSGSATGCACASPTFRSTSGASISNSPITARRRERRRRGGGAPPARQTRGERRTWRTAFTPCACCSTRSPDACGGSGSLGGKDGARTRTELRQARAGSTGIDVGEADAAMLDRLAARHVTRAWSPSSPRVPRIRRPQLEEALEAAGGTAAAAGARRRHRIRTISAPACAAPMRPVSPP